MEVRQHAAYQLLVRGGRKTEQAIELLSDIGAGQDHDSEIEKNPIHDVVQASESG